MVDHSLVNRFSKALFWRSEIPRKIVRNLKCSLVLLFIEQCCFRFPYITCRYAEILKGIQEDRWKWSWIFLEQQNPLMMWIDVRRSTVMESREQETGMRNWDAPGKLNFSISSLALMKHSSWPLTTTVFSDNWTAILANSNLTRNRRENEQIRSSNSQHFPN
jgi:hypothetical protein